MSRACLLWMGAKDGVGATTSVVNAACALQQAGHGRQVVCDWDAAYHGDVGRHFGEVPVRPVAQVFGHLAQLHGDRLAGFCQIHSSGVGAVCRDAEADDGDAPSVAEIRRRAHAVLVALSTGYDIVHIDGGSRIDPLIASAATLATHVIVIGRPDLTVIPAMERARSLWRRAYCPRQRLLILCNQWKIDQPWSLDLLRDRCDVEHIATAPFASEDLAAAQYAGVPLAVAQPTHPMVAAVRQAVADFLTTTAMAPTCRIDPVRLCGDAVSIDRGSGDVSTSDMLPPGLREACLQSLQQEIEARKIVATADLAREVERLALAVIDRLPPEQLAEVDRAALLRGMLDDAVGFGPLAPLLRDPTVTEVMVNGPDQIFIERDGRIQSATARLVDSTRLMHLIERIVAPTGRRVDEGSPMVDARLPDGARVNVILPPLVLNGPTITIRRFPQRRLTMEDLVAGGSVTRPQAALLRQLVGERRNILVSGGTGTGKTTLLNILSASIPPAERIVTIEDAAELQLAQPHVVRLEARPPNLEGRGGVTIRDLVRNALRMRPDRIVVGECRGGEALDMLQAMNTGHDGSLTTVHANSPRDCLRRLETLVLFAGIELPLAAIREQVAAAIHYIVQLERRADGRRVLTEIARVERRQDGNVILSAAKDPVCPLGPSPLR